MKPNEEPNDGTSSAAEQSVKPDHKLSQSTVDSPFEVAREAEFEFGSSVSSSRRSVLTITLLFYLVTSGAILSACLRTLVGRVQWTDASFFGLLVAGSAVGFFLSMICGFCYFRSVVAACVAGAAGIVVGAIAGALSLVESDAFSEVAMIAFGGCWLMTLVMLLSARLQSASMINRARS